jgi:hypothetical protein
MSDFFYIKKSLILSDAFFYVFFVGCAIETPDQVDGALIISWQLIASHWRATGKDNWFISIGWYEFVMVITTYFHFPVLIFCGFND